MGSIPIRGWSLFERLSIFSLSFCSLLPPAGSLLLSLLSRSVNLILLSQNGRFCWGRLRNPQILIFLCICKIRFTQKVYCRLSPASSLFPEIFFTALSQWSCRNVDWDFLDDFPSHGLPFEFTVHHPDLFSLTTPLRVTTADASAAAQLICGMVAISSVSHYTEEPFLLCLTSNVDQFEDWFYQFSITFFSLPTDKQSLFGERWEYFSWIHLIESFHSICILLRALIFLVRISL